MTIKINSKKFKKETYYCRECDTDILEDQVNKQTWCCNNCGKKILIENVSGTSEYLVRLLPKDVTKYDSVFDQYTRKFFNIKGITNENGKYKFGIAGFRMLKVNKDEFINCLWNDQ